MAPVKFEEHIKDKLEQRAIKPSETAWNKLADRLDTNDQKLSHAKFWWIGIAASIVIVLVVSNIFFNNNEVSNGTNTIKVVNSNETGSEVKEQLNSSETVTTEEVSDSEMEKTTIEKKNQIQPNFIQQEQKVAAVKVKNQPKNTISKNLKIDRIAFNKVNDRKKEINKLNIENPEKTNTIASTNSIAEKTENIDSEIDNLLAKAQKDVYTKTVDSKEELKISPQGLLEEVEFDLDQSFRDKVFQKIKTSYKKVSTAVAHRND
ncbi:MSCRAMM family adhesin SdrC [Hanstruepera flava]|uniref:MSCRAMM family adhesin SdrC n=1 Tax=Hanstruepera flava TaxID=2930218 RepID=UPI002028185B|nr:MSCRAMM family adhesin SdrC [Hanstruepera flava]